MKKIKPFLLFIISGIFIAGYTFLNIDAYSVNFGDTYYVVPADFTALVILAYYILPATVYFALRNYINFRLGIFSFFFVTLPIIYMCWFNGIGEAVSLYNPTIWTSEYSTNGIILLFLTGNILFFINLITGISRLIKENNPAIT